MKKETIVYNGQNYNRYPDSKRKQHRVYYWKHDKWKSSPVPLHRQIWIDNFGDIPKGYIVHHKDGNTLNNSTDNFELLSNSEHAILHMKERRKKRIGICENPACGKEFEYFSVRKAKFCSYKCYSVVRRAREREKIHKS